MSCKDIDGTKKRVEFQGCCVVWTAKCIRRLQEGCREAASMPQGSCKKGRIRLQGCRKDVARRQARVFGTTKCIRRPSRRLHGGCRQAARRLQGGRLELNSASTSRVHAPFLSKEVHKEAARRLQGGTL